MKATIVIINYNDRRRVQRAILSALNQTWQDVEVIVVDDGSDSETRKVYEQYKSRIKLLQLERTDATARTPSRARNAGIEAAAGKYISFLDSDNYIEPEFIESLIKLDSDVAVCNWRIVGKQLHDAILNRYWRLDVWTQKDNAGLLSEYLQKTQLDHQALLIRLEYLKTIGLYDSRLPRSQDCDLIVRLMLGGGVWKHHEKILFNFEKHEDDQMKSVASIHGKTLWTLKNNLNITWLCNTMSRSPYLFASVMRGIKDFTENAEWKADYDKSEFKEFLKQHAEILSGERQEK